MRRYGAIVGGALVLATGVAVPAQAATVTIGSPLTASFKQLRMCSGFCTLANSKVQGGQAEVAATGTVLDWSVKDAAGSFALRVLEPHGNENYVAVGTSATESPGSTGIETFATSLPVKAGDLIGLDNEIFVAEIGIASPISSETIGVSPPLAEGESTLTSTEYFAGKEEEVAFNAQVEYVPPPEQTREVTPEQHREVTPPPVEEAHCVVPKLTGKKLKAAQKKLRGADCKLGKVEKLTGAISNSGKVKSQGPKPGKVLAPGSKVNVKLG